MPRYHNKPELLKHNISKYKTPDKLAGEVFHQIKVEPLSFIS